MSDIDFALAPRSWTDDGSTLPFAMSVEDAFAVDGVGFVSTGTIRQGTVRIGDAVEVVGERGGTSRVVRLEVDRRSVGSATYGTNVGLFLLDVSGIDIGRGQVLCAPGSMSAHSEFVATVTLKVDPFAKPSDAPLDTLMVNLKDSRGPFACGVSWIDGLTTPKPGIESRVRFTLPRAVAVTVGSSVRVVGPGPLRGDGTVTSVGPVSEIRSLFALTSPTPFP